MSIRPAHSAAVTGSAFQFSLVFLCLAVGNFSYQLATTGDWYVATERSFFQAIALFVAWVTGWMQRLNQFEGAGRKLAAVSRDNRKPACKRAEEIQK